MSTNNTSSKGAGIGSKIKGAAEVAHGFGDIIRGTLLGGVDRATGHQSEHDDIAARGRMEVSQGMAKIRGAGSGATAGYESGGGFGTGTGSQNQAEGAEGAGGMPSAQYGNVGQSGGYEDQSAARTSGEPGMQKVHPDTQHQQLRYRQGGEFDKDQSASAYQQGYSSQVDRK